jgi:hypothetical protein
MNFRCTPGNDDKEAIQRRRRALHSRPRTTWEMRPLRLAR